MIILDPEGLFNGDRLRACSNEAQLHFHRFLLASNGFGRLEINYHKVIGVAYSTFRPPPSEADFHEWINEYVNHSLLFPYAVDGIVWGQWDTNPRLLPRYKNATDRRSPIPPEPQYTQWKRRYLSEKASFPKDFGNFTKTFCPVVAVVDVVAGVVEDTHKPLVRVSKPKVSDLNGKESQRWEEFWGKYPRKQHKDMACRNFLSYVTLETEAAAFACLERYLRSAEVARGVVMNPDKWLLEQYNWQWEGDWPRREKTIHEIIEEMPDDQ